MDPFRDPEKTDIEPQDTSQLASNLDPFRDPEETEKEPQGVDLPSAPVPAHTRPDGSRESLSSYSRDSISIAGARGNRSAASDSGSTLSDAGFVRDARIIPQNTFGNGSNFSTQLQNQIRRARRKNHWLTPPTWLSRVLQLACYVFLACVVYFLLVGFPLWQGAVYHLWYAYKQDLRLKAGASIVVGVAVLYAVIPLLGLFENPPQITEEWSKNNATKAAETAVIIACHKAADVIGHTVTQALKTFPSENIFVIANGNSDRPVDHTGDICEELGVRHIWVPIGSKICGQYVGVAAAHRFRYCLLIDDDVALPDPFPVVTDRIQVGSENERRGNAKVKCIGYTLHATDGDGEPGSLCQQAQDLEYKSAGLIRSFWSRYGSASFPHGAISLWERKFLFECFQKHPGYRISEDWFFGLVCRELGGRIGFCSQVFVKTAVPKNLIRGDGSKRAGYGELTVTKQRLWRWNFFLVARLYHNSRYLLCNWRLRQYEFFTKLEVFRDLYCTLLLLAFPFIMPVALGASPAFTVGLSVGVTVMYYLVIALFAEVHLRLRKETVSRKVVYLYYPVYKLWLRVVNIASCYAALFNYARYWSVRHPKVIEDERLLQHMLDLVGEDNGDIRNDGAA